MATGEYVSVHLQADTESCVAVSVPWRLTNWLQAAGPWGSLPV